MQERRGARCGEAMLMVMLLLVVGLRGAASLPAQPRASPFLPPRAGVPKAVDLLRLPLVWGEEDTAGALYALRGRLPRLSLPGPDRYRRGIVGINTVSRDRTHDLRGRVPPPRISARHVDGFFTHRYSKLLGEEAARHALRALLTGARRDEVADDGSERRIPLRREARGFWVNGEDDNSDSGDEQQQQDGWPHHTGRSKSSQQRPRSRPQPQRRYFEDARLDQEFMTPLQY
ncbi:uncharacterized protein LOC116946585 isoform X1 [Petromyzon marinus]|uniref:uncharacterized protein LOC116946585 isoform X1 n=1 Tax=Petromyzon marinus TaxID=7757 RepID=UPI003F6F19CE